MAEIRFDDGAAYERMMGVWSRMVGEIFLDWVAPKPGLSWVDVGCGNGAFTELIVQRCALARCTASIRRKVNSHLRARALARARLNSSRATR
jgi:trans-aconitate methyltransferase